jgi:phosphohistidine phosphatase SixA
MAGPLLVVRHGVAVPRHLWSGDDARRPLTPEGEAQAAMLSEWLARQPFTVGHLLSSPTLRCTATLEPLSERTGQPIEEGDQLLPGREAEAGDLARRLLAGDGGLLCTHGEVVPDLLTVVGATLEGPPPEETEKGAVWLLRPPDGTGAAMPGGYAGRARHADDDGRHSDGPRGPGEAGEPGTDVGRVVARYLGPAELAEAAGG